MQLADLPAQIMMGVHGNGLTALLWMKVTPRSTVLEFFYPGGFAHDYEYTTRALGMVHYGFWGDRYVSSIRHSIFVSSSFCMTATSLVPKHRQWHIPRVSKGMRSPLTVK
jgi:hypothetical protein